MGKDRRSRERGECAPAKWDAARTRGESRERRVSNRGDVKNEQLEKYVLREAQRALDGSADLQDALGAPCMVMGCEVVGGGSHATVVVATRADEPRRIAAGDAAERASLRVRHELARTLNKKRAMTVSIVLIGAA